MDIDNQTKEALEELLQESKDIVSRFGLAINSSENILGGVVTKYRIWEGKIFLIQQAITQKAGYIWKVWFKNNYNASYFRSAEDYKRLANVPEIIRYSAFGKERLLGIVRLIDDLTTEDPVGEFLEENGIVFDPQQETDPVKIKRQADIAVNYKKIVDAGITGVTLAQVKAYVRNGKEIKKSQIDSLKVGNNPSEQMNKLIASDGKVEPLMTPERNADVFKKATDNLLRSIEKAIGDSSYLGSIDADVYRNLKQGLLNLEPLIIKNN
jgi:hypothetical protein